MHLQQVLAVLPSTLRLDKEAEADSTRRIIRRRACANTAATRR